MNIALVSLYFFPIRGGLETAVYNLAKALIKKGHNVTILTSLYPLSQPNYEIVDKIPIHRLNFSSPFSILKLFKIIKQNKTEVINIHYLGIYLFYLVWLKSILKFKIILTTHGFPFYINLINKVFISFNRFLLSYALKKSDKIVINTNKEQSLIQQTMPSVLNKSYVIPNGVDLEEFNRKEKYTHHCPYIFSLLRFRYEKGFDILIMAFEIIVKKGYKVDLIISGWGDQLWSAKKMISLLGLQNRIFIFEHTERNELIKLFNGCEFFVLPSRVESFGIVNLEAMAAGKAIVATKVGSIPEVVQDNINGILVEPKDDKALAEGMISLLEDKALCQKLGYNGRRMVKNYSYDKIAEEYLQVYMNAINNVSIN